MHEYSIVSALVDQVEAQAAAHPGAKVRTVLVAIGAQAGVEAELLAAAFEAFRGGTVCADAVLEIVPRPARWVCPTCKTELPRGARPRCVPCASAATMVSGDEILLQRIELELEN